METTAQQDEYAATRYRAGLSYRDIARELGVTRSVVAGMIFRHRQRHKQSGKAEAKPFWTGDKIAKLRELHAGGLSTGEIAAEIGRTREAVRQQGVRMGLSWKGRSPKKNTQSLAFTAPKLTDEQIERNQRENDRRFVRALALAFLRGDHLPAEKIAA